MHSHVVKPKAGTRRAEPGPEEGVEKDPDGNCFYWGGSDAAPSTCLCLFYILHKAVCIIVEEEEEMASLSVWLQFSQQQL